MNMSFINIDKKTFWAIVNIGLIGMLVGGMVTVVVVDFVETPSPAAIGQLTSPSSIQPGMWFRYDTNKGWADAMVRRANWTLAGGYPYVIVECVGITTFGALGDQSAEDGPDRLAYNWTVTPYWQNDVKAVELLNGSVVNDVWELCFKQLWIGVTPFVTGSANIRARWWIDPVLGNWSDARPANNLASYKTSFIRAIGGVQDVQSGIQLDIQWTPSVYKYNRPASMELGYDADTHLLYYALIDDKFSPSTGQLMAFVLTGYSDGVNIKGKTPPLPAPVILSVDRIFGQPFEYALNIIGPFTTAAVKVTSNDSSALVGLGSLFTTSNPVIPIDIKASVNVTFSVTGNLNGLPMPMVNISAILDYITPLGKAVAVTLSSVTPLGNSFNATWTSNPAAEEYWVMVNDTFALSTIGTEVLFQVGDGSWNITIVVVDTAANETSVPSNGIIISYATPVNETAPAPASYAVDPERTDITPPLDPMLFVYFLIIPIVAATIALLLVYLTRTGRIKLAVKQSSKKVGGTGTVSRKK